MINLQHDYMEIGPSLAARISVLHHGAGLVENDF